MEKIKSFFTTHSTEIIAILVAVSAFITSLTNVGGLAGNIGSIIVGVLAVIIATVKMITYYFSSGLDEHLVNMAVALIQMIVELMNGTFPTTTAAKAEGEARKSVTGNAPQTIKITKEDIEKEYRKLLEEQKK